MADYSTIFSEDPTLYDRALSAFGDGLQPYPPQEAAPAQPVAAQAGPAPEPVPVDAGPTMDPTGSVDMRVLPDVERPRGSLGQQQQALVGESVGAANETAQSFAREGDAKADASLRAAELYGKQAQVADRYAAAAERNYNDHQERAAYYRRMVDEDYERLKQEAPRPGAMKNAFNVITGIIGAAAGGSTGDALGMLRQHVNREAEIDAQERGAAMQRIGVAEKIQDSILSDSANEFDASAKLVANQWMAASRQLEQISNESNVPAFREQALRLSIQAQEQARGILSHNVDAQIKQRAATAAAMRPRWDSMTQGELEALQRAGVLPIEAAEKLAKLQKAQRDAAGPEADPKAPRSVPGRQVVNPEAFASARDVDLAKFRDTEAKMKALDATLDKLDAKLATHGTEAFGEQSAEMEALAASALGTIKDVKTLGTLDNGLLAFGEKLLGDPTSWYRSGSSVRTRIKASRTALREEVEAMAESIGLNRRQETTVDDQAAAFGAVPKAAPVPVASSGGAP